MAYDKLDRKELVKMLEEDGLGDLIQNRVDPNWIADKKLAELFRVAKLAMDAVEKELE